MRGRVALVPGGITRPHAKIALLFFSAMFVDEGEALFPGGRQSDILPEPLAERGGCRLFLQILVLIQCEWEDDVLHNDSSDWIDRRIPSLLPFS